MNSKLTLRSKTVAEGYVESAHGLAIYVLPFAGTLLITPVVQIINIHTSIW